MKVGHQVSFNGNQILEKELTALGVGLNVTPTLAGGNYVNFTIFESDPQWKQVSILLQRHKIQTAIGTIFEPADFKTADWFYVTTKAEGYPQPSEDFGYLQQSFDLKNYCKICGIGKIQNKPLRIMTEPKNQKLDFFGLNWLFYDVFVKDSIIDVLKKNNITGITFDKPTIHKSGVSAPNYSQILVQNILKEGSLVPFNLMTERCEKSNIQLDDHIRTNPATAYCNRSKFNHPKRGGFTFKPEALKNAPDFLKSSEWMGSGGNANRLTLVSRKFYELATKEKWKGITFFPVFIEEIRI